MIAAHEVYILLSVYSLTLVLVCTYSEFNHEGIDDRANDGDEVERVPGVLEVALFVPKLVQGSINQIFKEKIRNKNVKNCVTTGLGKLV